MPKRGAGDEAAFTAVANAGIANEICTYFPDTGLYRRLCRGGAQHADDYLHREFAPAEATARRAAGEAGVAAVAASSRSASPPQKRRRASIVERLERDLAEFTRGAAACSSSSAAGTTAAAGTAFTVSCRGCASRVLARYPCGVLTGYVVLWAESVLEVECVATACAAQSKPLLPSVDRRELRGQHGQLKHANAKSGPDQALPPMGLRPLLHRRARGTGRVGTFPSESRAQDSAPSQVLSVTLHSLHIVNRDAVLHARPASFALQSVLQPGRPTVLECYPRHMIHFGLLVYAAWQASTPTWQGVLAGAGTRIHTEQGTAKVTSGLTAAARSSRKRTRAPDSSGDAVHAGGGSPGLAALMPHTAQDAVLVLGLGGNALGKCLDALLPPAVPLHVVEVEPAVLQACCEHEQFPAGAAVIQGLHGTGGDAPRTSASPRLPPSARPSRRQEKPVTTTASPAQATQVCGMDSTVVKWAADVVQRRCSTAAVAMCAVRQASSTAASATSTAAGAAGAALAGKKHRTGQTAASPASSRPPRTAVIPETAPHGSYVCFLQDAYAFLRGSATPPSSSAAATARHRGATRATSTRQASPAPRAARSASASLSAPTSEGTSTTTAATQYSLIFLDCYDPDREHMMHEGTLVELCARRLRPGGVLLVNAHVLPTVEALQRDFLSHGFATVQALRVSGCTQTVVACVVADASEKSIGEGTSAVHGTSPPPTLAERRARFTVGRIQQLAAALNADLRHGSTGGAGCAFQFDATWLKSSRRVVVPRRPRRVTPASADANVDLVVWQHHF